MKVKMRKHFSANSTQKYIDILDDMVHDYNNQVHSSINLIRTKASVKKKEVIVCDNLFGDLDFAPLFL